MIRSCLFIGLIFITSACGLKFPETANDRQAPVTKLLASFISLSSEPYLAQNRKYIGESSKTVEDEGFEVDSQMAGELGENGTIFAQELGKVLVHAEFADFSETIELRFQRNEITIKETQFWVYQTDKFDSSKVHFNFPWDDIDGDDITTSTEKIAAYALSCAERAKATFERLLQQPNVRELMGQALSHGAVSQAIILVNVIDSMRQHQALRILDRDAYFWHWNNDGNRPVLSMSNFKRGLWVWEVIAAPPDNCLQVPQQEVLRYLEYVNSRLAGAN